jgi:uncharacterized protein YecT (DUF1311 family)
MHLSFTGNARALAACVALLPLAGHAATPSFLCSKAKSWVEKTICASDRLSELDLDLATVYARLLRVTSGETEKTLATEQRRWWGSRDDCRKQAAPVACLETRYVDRIAQLKARPDYTEARPGKVELAPERLVKVGEGWTKSLGRYLKPIRACMRRAKEPVKVVGVAWDSDDGQSIGVRMTSRSGFHIVCTAQRDGSDVVGLRDANPFEPLPEEGPLFYPDPSAPPADACGKPVQILDEFDAPVGWLGPSCAPKAAKPEQPQKDPEASPEPQSEVR